MSEKPIIFNGQMVNAILRGRKTQTRRVVKITHKTPGLAACLEPPEWAPARPTVAAEICPYGQPGDRLWIRHPYDVFPVYFKPIPGWEDRYAAGTDGFIYRMDNGEPRVLKGVPTDRGYLSVSLSRGDWITKSVHRLVCEAFYGPSPFDAAQVRHMDGNRKNNDPSNLDWGSQGENWQDRKAHGRGMGEAHHAAKLKQADADAIRKSSLSQRALARQYGVSQSTIWEILSGRAWTKHAPGPRNTKAWKPWASPRFMPRWASRITLEITGVRVERVQDISCADAISEGIPPAANSQTIDCETLDPRHTFSGLWDHINATRGYGWDVNPWVWVIEFRRMQ